MASLIGSGMASDSLSSRLADDVPCEVSGRLEGVSVREHRGLVSGWLSEEIRGYAFYAFYGSYVEAVEAVERHAE